MNILIVGGTGNISWRLSQAAVSAGWRVTLLNRGAPDRPRRPMPTGCLSLIGDIRDPVGMARLLEGRTFDAVIDFLCFNEDHARQAVSLFGAHTAHYLFISSTAIYDRQIARTPLTEASPILGSGWDYALAKAAAEAVFAEAKASGFPVTVIRPGHTYDTIIPEAVGDGNWTNPWRMLTRKPIVLHGDGTTLWTVTHSSDFASGLMALLSSGHPPGETFHITADETYNWRQITAAVAAEIGAPAPLIHYRTTAEIESMTQRYANGIKWHKMWCDIYDNRKFKAACPSWRATISLEEGIREAVGHFRAHPDLLAPSAPLDTLLDEICAMRPL